MDGFTQQRLLRDTRRNWDLFYKRHATRFFKDRHWTSREWPLLETTVSLLELGCGVGNLVAPLKQARPNFEIYCCDLSPRAVEFASKHAPAFVCDITTDEISLNCPQVHTATCVFVLSAIAPSNLPATLANISRALLPGGTVLVRDYADNDAAQLRFTDKNKMDGGFYARSDGTLTNFFTVENMHDLFVNAGFKVQECAYVEKDVVNVKRGISFGRRFVQGVFSLPQ